MENNFKGAKILLPSYKHESYSLLLNYKDPIRFFKLITPDYERQQSSFCKRFQPRSHFINRLSMIVRVNVVLNRTVVVDSD